MKRTASALLVAASLSLPALAADTPAGFDAILVPFMQATDRLAEAEPLMRRALEIFVTLTRATGHHPHLQDVVYNYVGLLKAMEGNHEEIHGMLHEWVPEFYSKAEG